MAKTKHIQARMSQRAIRQCLLDIAVKFGSYEPDGKIVLTHKTLKYLLEECQNISKAAQHGLKKGGLVVVESERGDLITAYALKKARVRRRPKSRK